MTNKIARGGTELMAGRIDRIMKDAGLDDKINIIHSRVRNVSSDRPNILVLHDLPNDPESQHLRDGGWQRFDRLVFVSNWQQQMYAAVLGVPYSTGTVIENAIEPIPAHTKPEGPKQIIYTSTPHRGLEHLYIVFSELCQEYDLRLRVCSSFDLYGWGERDKEYTTLFEKLKSHPKISYTRSIPNDEVRKELTQSHIWTLPSIWPETSCLALIEAMSAGCECVHSSLGALPETAMGRTRMYGFTENNEEHLVRLYNTLTDAVESGNNVATTHPNHTLDGLRERWVELVREVLDE
jgi:glycosyltransferase involved in cell wall biosynthesis